MKKLAMISRVTFLASLGFLVMTAIAPKAEAQNSFYALTPCRVVDTRNPNSVNGGPKLVSGRRDFTVRGVCGVPTSAKAVTLNVAITGASSNGYLTLWPSNLTQPTTATINFTTADLALSNGAIVGVGNTAQDLAVFNATSGVHLILDVTGYFE